MHFSSVASVLFLGQSALAAGVPRDSEPTSTAATTCSPHGDHWHCPSGVPQPALNPDGSTNTKATQVPKATAAPHDDDDDDHDHDHDHDSDKECEPHGDHWHCPSGVAQPSLNPDGSVNTKATKVAQSTAAAETTGADHDHDHDHDHGDDDKCTPHGDHWHCPSGVAEPDHPPPTTLSTTPSPTGNANSGAPTTTTATAGAVAVGVPIGIAATLAVMLSVVFA